MEKLITKSFKRLLDKGIHRGFITYEELGKSLGKRHFSQENIEKAFLYLVDSKVSLVEKKSDFKTSKRKEAATSDSEKSKDVDKSDDPIRMYLREMGGVELLSREGEIAIAKRIEAGRDVMINALFQSPLTAKKVFEWRDQLEKNELLVREIIDIDSAYIETDDEENPIVSKKNKQHSKKEKEDDKNKLEKSKKQTDNAQSKNETEGEGNNEEYLNEDEFNPSLAAMEEEIRPQIIQTINILCKNYLKLTKYQNDKLNLALNAKEFSKAREKEYKKTQDIIINKIKTLQLNSSVLENLVQSHYQENKKIISLEGVLLRSALENKISREEFLKYYL